MKNVGILFYPKEDECFYGYLLRYHRYSGNRTVAETKNDLFGHPKKTISFHFTGNLNVIGKVLSHETSGKIDADYIMKHLFLVNFAKPFIRQETYSKFVSGLLNSTTDVYKYSGLFSGGLYREDYKRIKTCPICFKNDVEKYGEAIIRLSHNIPGAVVCKHHGCYLDTYQLTVDDFYNLVDINQIYREKPVRYPDQKIEGYYHGLNEDIEFILSGGLENETYESLSTKLKEKMKFANLYKEGKRVKCGVFRNIFQSYPESFLEELGLYDERLKKNHWFRKVIHEKEKPIHYLPFLLITRYFFRNLTELVDYIDVFEPFGRAPYPCLNPFCSQFEELKIDDYIILDHKTNGGSVASFRCEECGLTYTRVASKTNDNKFSYSRILSRGPIWFEKLEENFQSNQNTQEELAIVFNVSRSTIQKYYKQFKTKGTLDCYILPKKKNRIVDLKERKRRYNEFIKSNPNCTRAEIQKNLNKDVLALRRTDRKWLEENLPPKQLTGFHQLWQGRKPYND
jgi:hypothetical protein